MSRTAEETVMRRRRPPVVVLLLAVVAAATVATTATAAPASAGAGCHRKATEGSGFSDPRFAEKRHDAARAIPPRTFEGVEDRRELVTTSDHRRVEASAPTLGDRKHLHQPPEETDIEVPACPMKREVM